MATFMAQARLMDIHPGDGKQDCRPGAGGLGNHVAKRHKQRGYTFRAIKHAIDAANVLGSESIARGGAEQAVDFAPGEENQTAQEDKSPGIAPECGERDDAEAFQ